MNEGIFKVGFVVEGDRDKEFVEGLAPRVLPSGSRVHVVRVGGKAALPWSFSTVAHLVARGYGHVMVLADADTDVPSEIRQYQRRLESNLRRFGLDREARICLAVPMLEAWLLARYVDDPERDPDPKHTLERCLDGAPPVIGALAKELPLDIARRRSKSFDTFVQTLEEFASPHARPARKRRTS